FYSLYSFSYSVDYLPLLSFPTRRSSDLGELYITQAYHLYSQANHETWRCLYERIRPRWERYANDHFLAGIEALHTVPSAAGCARSEEHTSELQSRGHLVCRLLLEKKNKK